MERPQVVTFEGTGDKKILIIAGVHGDEITAVSSVFGMIKGCCFTEFRRRYKTLTFIPNVNIDAIKKGERSFENKPNEDLNRAFKKDDFDCKKFLKPFLDYSDVVIDIHNSPQVDTCMLIDYGRHQEAASICFDASVSYIIRPFEGNTIKKWCIDNSKLAVTVEASGMNYVKEASELEIYRIVEQFLSSYLSGNVDYEEYKFEPSMEIKANKEGFYKPFFKFWSARIGTIDNKVDPEEMMILPFVCNFVGCRAKDYVVPGEDIGFATPLPTRTDNEEC